MNRLWVRLSLMIAGVLFFMFFVQFLSIIFDAAPPGVDDTHLPDGSSPVTGNVPRAEIARRLLGFAVFSLVVGGAGGVVIARVVSAPVSDLAKAARRIGQGNLDARVPVHGSQEMQDLATMFNGMAAELQLERNRRNSLMADVSHELRTPLTVLEGNLRAALDRVYALDQAEIANLYGQTRHLIRLVNDLNELSLAETRQLPLEKQPTDLNALVMETVQALEPLAEEKEVRVLDETNPLPEISADGMRIRQVLFNLLSNALRHTPRGGEIRVNGMLCEREIILSVQDNGEGLSAGELDAVFDRFYRADKSRSRDTGGTGLGLAIVKAIVQAHGGRVQASSEGKGKGSTFTLVLPWIDSQGV